MKKLFFLFLLCPIFLQAQALVYQLGGVQFEHCESLIQHNGQDIMSLRIASDGTFLLHADVFNEGGKLVATVRDNVTTGRIILRQDQGGLRLYDESTHRLIAEFSGKPTANGVNVQVSLNAFLPNKKRLIATPEESAYPELAGKKGATVKGGKSAIALN